VRDDHRPLIRQLRQALRDLRLSPRREPQLPRLEHDRAHRLPAARCSSSIPSNSSCQSDAINGTNRRALFTTFATPWNASGAGRSQRPPRFS
jgi:hypothetical protein